MKVLVTGSAGFIGAYVTAELTARGHEPVPFDRPADVRDAAGLTAAAQLCGGIIHLAGMLGTEEMIGAELAAADVNILGAITVMDTAAKLGLPLVVIGTGHKGQPNTYAITKGCAEDLALARSQWLGDKIAVVRAYHVYGAGQPAPPPWGGGHCRKIFPVFACCALTGTPLPLHAGGGQLVDMVHASSAARVLAAALDGPYGEVAEAGTGHAVTVAEVAADIAAAAGAGGGTQVIGPRRGEPEGAAVYAACPSPLIPPSERWPYLLPGTLGWYAGQLRPGGSR